MSNLRLNTDAPPEKVTLFVDVILPIPIPKLFTYRVPVSLSNTIQIGCRVIVQFGAKKILTGIVGKVHNSPPDQYEAKLILEQLEEDPIVQTKQLELFDWIANYYMCCRLGGSADGTPSEDDAHRSEE